MKADLRVVGAAMGGGAVACLLWSLWQRYGGVLQDVEKHGGQIVAEVLRGHGVDAIFTLAGGHVSPILTATEETGIKVVDVRNEVNAVFAADCYSRLKGIPGVAVVTAGPGVTNAVTAIKNAQMAESPLVLIGGAAPGILQGRGALQDIDQMALMQPITKMAVRVERLCRLASTLQKAFQVAASGVPGPVFIELPVDILYPVFEVRANIGLYERRTKATVLPTDIPRLIVPDDLVARGVSPDAYLESKPAKGPVFLRRQRGPRGIQGLYFRLYVRSIFASAWDSRPHTTTPLPLKVPLPSRRQVGDIAGLLRRAKRPVLVLQAQVMRPAVRPNGEVASWVQPLVAAVSSFGIPTYLGGMARGLLGVDSPVAVRQERRLALAESDLVLLVGATADFRLDYGRSLGKAKIVTINRSRKLGALNGTGPAALWRPYRVVEADPATTVIRVAERIAEEGGGSGQRAAEWRGTKAEWSTWLQKCRARDAAKDAKNAAQATQPAVGHGQHAGKQLMNPIALCTAVEKGMSRDAIVIGDGGDFIGTAAYVVRPRGPLRWLDPGPFGTLGVGGGFALAAKVCCPESEVWLLWGDGSVGYSVAEFDTMKRFGLGVVAVVGNDAAWTQILRDQVQILGRPTACLLEYTPYEEVAKGYGGDGAAFDGNEQGAVTQAVTVAKGAAKRQPYLLNVLIGSSTFREGSLSV